MKIKKGDNVIVITGKHKGATGKVSAFSGDRVRVDGVNKIKHHIKPKTKSEKGSIVEREAMLHVSNIMITSDGKRSRIGTKTVGDSRVRVAKKTGIELK